MLLVLLTAGCDLDFLFIEPASGGEAQLFTVPREGGQGADPERLASLDGGMDSPSAPTTS